MFHKSIIMKNLELFKHCPSTDDNHNFGYMRYLNDMYILYKTCEYFQPKNILEIGFFMGQSFGLMCEACPNSNLTAVDINFNTSAFDACIQNQSKITLIKQDSKNINFPSESFDFVMVDGDHSYEYASNDIRKAFACITQTGILAVDDFFVEGVYNAICNEIISKTDWEPFLWSDNVLYFHHPSHNAGEFLDTDLHQCPEFVKLHTMNIEIGESRFDVLKSFIRYESISDFIRITKEYNI